MTIRLNSIKEKGYAVCCVVNEKETISIFQIDFSNQIQKETLICRSMLANIQKTVGVEWEKDNSGASHLAMHFFYRINKFFLQLIFDFYWFAPIFYSYKEQKRKTYVFHLHFLLKSRWEIIQRNKEENMFKIKEKIS